MEFLNLVKGLLLEARILNLDEAHKSYLNILNDHLSDLCPCRKTVRQMITDNIEDVEFIRAYQRNKPDCFCPSAAKIAAVESAVRKPSNDSKVIVIYECVKIVRKEISEASTWQFNGSLDQGAGNIVPMKLFTLLQWIISGVASDLHTEQRTEEVNNKAMLLAQQIMYHTKTIELQT